MLKIKYMKPETPSDFRVDTAGTAVMIMDYQNDILGTLPETERTALVEKASVILAAARHTGLPIVYVVVQFRDGYPEVSPRNKVFSGIKDAERLREGSEGAAIHPGVAPQQGELVVTKRRVGAFSSTDLGTILRAKDIDTLILFGVSTSGVVLSTLRWAADMDYKLFVVSDACADRDKEIHQVLTEKVFPRQATVLTTEDLIKAMKR